VPIESIEVVKLATPPLGVAVPNIFEPSLNVTLLVGVPLLDAMTLTVDVAAWLETDGSADEPRTVLVPGGWAVPKTTSTQ
jgi:hypothetical protein